jgi:hypothetical protein
MRYSDFAAADHRRYYSQFKTPNVVAEFMIAWIKSRGVTEVFNPGTGIGTFISCAKDQGIAISGVEADFRLVKTIMAKDVVTAPKVRHGDYLLLPKAQRRCIISTPPITPIRRYYTAQDDYSKVCKAVGYSTHQTTYLYILWLYKAMTEIQNGGIVALFVPADFLSTITGKVVREKLISSRSLHAIIRIEDAEFSIIAEAEGQVIPHEWVIVLADTRAHADAVSFRSCTMSDLYSQSGVNLVSYSKLYTTSSWQIFLTGCANNDSKLVPITKYGRFKRGILSGANRYFSLTPSDAASLQLKESEIRACIHKYTDAKNPVFSSSDFRKLIDEDAPSFIFYASKKMESISAGAQSYIEYGEKLGLPKISKLSQATPWYSFVHSFTPADYWLWVYVRDDYRLVLNQSGVLNSSIFHGFFLHPSMQEWRIPLFLFLLSKAGKKLINGGICKYKSRIKQYTVEALNSAMVPDTYVLSRLSDNADKYLDEISSTGAVPVELDNTINSFR